MPQSLSVFAVSLQEHPELLQIIMPLLLQDVKGYYSHRLYSGEMSYILYLTSYSDDKHKRQTTPRSFAKDRQPGHG
jgi:hypothetical protein